MLSEVDLVIYAIQAAVKLGRKVQNVFEDEVRDRELILPQVPGTTLPSLAEAETFFEGEGRVFVRPPAPESGEREGLYHVIWQKKGSSIAADDRIREAYRRLSKHLLEHSGREDVSGRFRKTENYCDGVNALLVVKQWRETEDPKRHPVQRIAGTVVEIALDYVKADPALFAGNGAGNRITRSFLLSLDEVKFAESQFDDLLLDILRAALDAIRVQAEMTITEDQLALLLGEISGTLADGIKKARENGDDAGLRTLYTLRRELLQNVIKTSAQTVSEHTPVFLGDPRNQREQQVSVVLRAVLDNISGNSDLFTGKAVAEIFGTALQAVALNTNLLVPGKDGSERGAFLQALIAGITNELAKSSRQDPPGLFSADLLQEVIEAALATLGNHAGRLISAANPQPQLLVEALRHINFALSSEFHRDTGLLPLFKGLLSRPQLIRILQEVFEAVARNPRELLTTDQNGARPSALSCLIAAVALAARADRSALLSGDDYRKLTTAALQAFALNPDRLLHLDGSQPHETVMAQVIRAVVESAAEHAAAGGRRLIQGGMLVQAVEAALRTVSKNVDGFRKEREIVSMVMDRLLAAAAGIMANELDGETLLLAFPSILRGALRDRKILDVSDAELILPVLTATG